jgi:hypothetical protein
MSRSSTKLFQINENGVNELNVELTGGSEILCSEPSPPLIDMAVGHSVRLIN